MVGTPTPSVTMACYPCPHGGGPHINHRRVTPLRLHAAAPCAAPGRGRLGANVPGGSPSLSPRSPSTGRSQPKRSPACHNERWLYTMALTFDDTQAAVLLASLGLPEDRRPGPGH